MPVHWRSAVAACMLLAGCSDPEEPTDLRSQNSGPPNVTTVTVMSDLASSSDPGIAGLPRLIETATHCRTDDAKRPGIVGLPDFSTTQVCPDDLSQPADTENAAEGAPPSWFVRVVFDKLLDPNIEDLVTTDSGTIGTLVHTQPVALRCGLGSLVDVAYDGYYIPNGNRVSWPLGPALYIAPLSPTSVPTGAQCELTLKDNVKSKVGRQVPDDQRTYTFTIAPMQLRFSVPAATDGAATMDIDTPVQLFWTAAMASGPAAADIKITKGPNLNAGATSDGDADPAICDGSAGTAVADADIETAPAPVPPDTDPTTVTESLALILDLDTKGNGAPHRWEPQTTYRIAFTPTAKVAPTQGGADGMLADVTLCFHTGAAAPM